MLRWLQYHDWKRRRVPTKIKNGNQPFALSTHCYVYSYEITKLVKFSPKRESNLPKIHEEEYYQNKDPCTSKFSSLRMFSEAPWTVRASSLTSIYRNCKELEELWYWDLDEYKIVRKRSVQSEI